MQSNFNLKPSIYILTRQALVIQTKLIMKLLVPEITKNDKQSRSIRKIIRQIIKTYAWNSKGRNEGSNRTFDIFNGRVGKEGRK